MPKYRGLLMGAAGILLAGALVLVAQEPTLPRTAAERARSMADDMRCPRFAISRPADPPTYGFYFTRGRYSGTGSGWATDFEKADRQLLVVLRRTLDVDAFPCENPVGLEDPALRHFPFLYMVEVGGMRLTRSQATGLREYLLAGGFLFVDDFWGANQWATFEREMAEVLPGYPIVEIPRDHPIFRIIYPIEEVLQVPCECNVGRGPAGYAENGGTVPELRGIFSRDGRLMAVISFNSDMGDAWEWAERPDYPWDRSNYAFQLIFNLITYALTN